MSLAHFPCVCVQEFFVGPQNLLPISPTLIPRGNPWRPSICALLIDGGGDRRRLACDLHFFPNEQLAPHEIAGASHVGRPTLATTRPAASCRQQRRAVM